MPAQGQPLSFSIEIGVRPRAKLGEYRGLEVGRREPHVDESAIDAEIERLRDRVATLETVERRPPSGDHVVIDYRRHGRRRAVSGVARVAISCSSWVRDA